MELIDDEGNLFGLVNVVDALVVLLVVAVVAAGAAFVFLDDSEPEPEPETATTFVTLDLGEQPNNVATAINEGDTYDPDGPIQLRITDVHLTPQNNSVRAIVRVEVTGVVTDEGNLRYSNAPLRLNRQLGISTERYEVDGRIRSVGDAAELTTESATVVLRQTINAEDAGLVTAGDQVRAGGRVVATVEEVATFATNNPTRQRVFVAVNLTTHRQQDDRRFGGRPVTRGQRVTLSTSEYTLNGRIERTGSDLQLGEPTTRTVTLRMDEVNRDIANAIRPGMTERMGDRTVARVTRVETEPSLIITTGDNGSVNVVEHPINRQVTITAELFVRESTTGTRFKSEPLRVGSRATLDLGTITVEATVTNIDN
jgi:hypothetical protein